MFFAVGARSSGPLMLTRPNGVGPAMCFRFALALAVSLNDLVIPKQLLT
jgi:hypothetical protein